jgi:hypothetical protein
MGSARRGTDKLLDIHESAVTDIDTTITMLGLDMGRPHCFVGVQFFSDSAGTTPVVPTLGTVTVKIKTYNTQRFELMPESTINAGDPTTISWAANTVAIEVIPSSIDVASYYKAVLTANEK